MTVSKDDNAFLLAVGRRIAELRRQSGLTQEELASAYDCSVKYVQKVELGGENLTLTTLARFASVFGTPTTSLLEAPASLSSRPGRPRRK